MLITVDELALRLKYELTDSDAVLAAEVIWDASNKARFFGRSTWTASAVPPVVKSIVRDACVRYMDLAESVLLSRAGDESEQYTDLREKTGTVFFSEDEKATIRLAAGRVGNMFSARTFVWSPENCQESGTVGYVPIAGSSAPFPYWAVDDGCW
jgi:hypothetical protein